MSIYYEDAIATTDQQRPWFRAAMIAVVATNLALAAFALTAVTGVRAPHTVYIASAESDDCESSKRTLEDAYMAWVKTHAAFASERNLVAAGFLDSESSSHDIFDGRVRAVPGSDCA